MDPTPPGGEGKLYKRWVGVEPALKPKRDPTIPEMLSIRGYLVWRASREKWDPKRLRRELDDALGGDSVEIRRRLAGAPRDGVAAPAAQEAS